ncbi:hypothetical protein [Microbacterium sp. E-13]|uniref:hypothetical protein n=1 Tax=Microbacterium sp. E-13 TaxID=3404048 RepID=UPI003CF070B6
MTLARHPATRRERATRIKDPLIDRVFMIGVYVLLSVFLLVVLLPLVYIVANSLSDASAVSAGRVTFSRPPLTGRSTEFRSGTTATTALTRASSG